MAVIPSSANWSPTPTICVQCPKMGLSASSSLHSVAGSGLSPIEPSTNLSHLGQHYFLKAACCWQFGCTRRPVREGCASRRVEMTIGADPLSSSKVDRVGREEGHNNWLQHWLMVAVGHRP